jgi:MerR family transcriptional regulator/heat shock protein HspR
MTAPEQTLFTISHIAKILAIHPQTLRLYERQGFITPTRTKGKTRLYSPQDIEQIRFILHLTRELGVNLAGVELILHMQQKLDKIAWEIQVLRQFLTESMQQHWEERRRQQALLSASSRKLIKAP